ncbi:hypothetical protein [Hydrogenophaga sp. 2FB]|uniref:hypothetical protein n=1 Tax=Hydrogenophaga sp. 2FB TaxID=2502187 RepID=UPI0010F5A243|nr:hypothetical protein [Hydrogenophaga sp. 2FB]
MGALSGEPLHGRGRQRVRSLKRLARSGLGSDAAPALRLQSQAIALALLDRSIKFKHRRLAILRLKEAAALGALIEAAQWSYCSGVVAAEQDLVLRAEFAKTVTRSRDAVQRLHVNAPVPEHA